MSEKSRKIFLPGQDRRQIVLGVTGACLALFGILCALLWESILNNMLDKAMILRPNSKIVDFWKSPPLELNLSFYLYNWTNPKDFRNLSTKPILEEVGPYHFVEIPNKVDIHWHTTNASVSYRRQSYFKFIESESKGRLSDHIVTINPVAVAATGLAKRCNYMRRGMIDLALKVYGDNFSVTKTVDELLFSGYNDVLLNVLNAMPRLLRNIDVPFDKFGYCYTRNGSSTLMGLYNVFTGADDISKLGQVNTWNHKKHTGKFGSHCGLINGSAGEFQPPHLKSKGTINIFIPELCRTIPLEYAETVEVEGVEGYKYVGGLRAVDNGTLYPENKCFCGGQCVPSGVMNMTSCWYDAPLFMSYPHFYKADPYYVNAVVGQKPDKKKHECFVTLEPRTGFILDVGARMQLNMLIEPVSYLELFKKAPRVFFPLFWFEEKIRVTPELAADLRMWPKMLLIGKVTAAFFILVGLGLIVWCQMDSKYSNWTNKPCPELQFSSAEKTKIATDLSINMNKQDKVHEKTLRDLPATRNKKPKIIMQSTSIDSGCPPMDDVSEFTVESNNQNEVN